MTSNTEHPVSGLAHDAEVTTALLTAVLALDRVLATTPSWSAAHDARGAIEAFLAEHAPDWPEMAADQIRDNDCRCAEQQAALSAESRRRLAGYCLRQAIDRLIDPP